MATLYGFALDFCFPVCFTRDVWDRRNPVFVDTVRRLEPERRHRVLFVIDRDVAAAHPSLISQIEDYVAAFPRSLELLGEPVLVPGGERVKNDRSRLFDLLARMNQLGIDRQSFVTAIGGGAVLDMAGFAAAIAHRGVRTIRLPTTVLSQADSGVAVKNGVNLFGKKNFIGTFLPPFGVINDSRFIETLQHRDKIAGVAEAIKVSLIRDAAFYEFLEAHAATIASGDLEMIARLIRRSAELHLQHICGSGDPFELGSARPLDFGHWAAHRLESLSGHRLRHGEAVAIGMALDLVYATKLGCLDEACADRILTLLDAIGFALWDDALASVDADGHYAILKGLQEFREHLGGQLHITLIEEIGHAFEVGEMDEALVIESIHDLCARRASFCIEEPADRLRGVPDDPQ